MHLPSALRLALLAGFALAPLPALHASGGALDTTFGDSGLTFHDSGSSRDTCVGAVTQSTGKVVVAGTGDSGDGVNMLVVSRYSADNDLLTLDTTFGVKGKSTIGFPGGITAATVALQSDDKILVAGWVGDGQSDDFALARFNADGTPDATFGGGDGLVTTSLSSSIDHAASLAILSDGRILAAGFSCPTTDPGGVYLPDPAIARYLPDGTLDTSFAGSIGYKVLDFGSTTGIEQINAIALQAGKIVVVGTTPNFANFPSIVLARYDSTTLALDTTFGTSGYIHMVTANAESTFAHALAVLPDNRLIVAGEGVDSDNADFTFDVLLLRYTVDGALDTTFDGPTGTGNGIVFHAIAAGSFDYAYGLAFDSAQRLVIGGVSRTITPDKRSYYIARCNDNGTLDTTFHTTGKFLLTPDSTTLLRDRAFPVIGQGDLLFLAGSVTMPPTANDFLLLGLHSGGNTSLFSSILSATSLLRTRGANHARAVAADNFGRVYVAASRFNGSDTDFAVTRYLATGAVDTDYGFGGTAYAAIASGSTDEVHALALDGAGRPVVVGSSRLGNQVNLAIARFDSAQGNPDNSFNGAGVVSTSFNTGATYASAEAVTIASTGEILVAGSVLDSGYKRFAIARYKSNGTLDSTFDSDGKKTLLLDANGDARAVGIALVGDRIYLGGESYKPSVGWTFGLYRLLASNGGFDGTFGGGQGSVQYSSGGTQGATCMLIQSDGKILLGGNSATSFRLLRLTAEGTVDNSFSADGFADVPIPAGTTFAGRGLAQQSDGAIAVAGQFNGGPALARLTDAGMLDTSFADAGFAAPGPFLEGGGTTSVHAYTLGGVPYLLTAGDVTLGGQSDILLARYHVVTDVTPTPTMPGSTTPTPTTPGTTAKPVVAITGKKKLITTKASVKVKGTAAGAVTAVLVDVGKKTVKATGTKSWSAKVKVKPGRNKLTVTATGPGGTSTPAKMTIVRR